MSAANNIQESIEDIILRHSARGMTLLKPHMPKNFCMQSARRILDLPRGTILLTTGFFVAGIAETDGPPGTIFTAKALSKLGFSPVILTDSDYRGLFEDDDPAIEYCYIDQDVSIQSLESILKQYQPCAMISIERCGHNKNGTYTNMRGVDITASTAPIDKLFDMISPDILTIGVGDGGNEIGMGNLHDILEKEVFEKPCSVTCSELIIATTSNWGAFALVAALSILSGKMLMPTFEEVGDYIGLIVSRGCVDGVTKETTISVDGFPLSVEKEISDALQAAVDTALGL